MMSDHIQQRITNDNSGKDNKEEPNAGKQAHNASVKEKEKENSDYWNRIAEDPASGYKNKSNDDPLLHADQEPDDHKRDDNAS